MWDYEKRQRRKARVLYHIRTNSATARKARQVYTTALLAVILMTVSVCVLLAWRGQ
jgi:hypothetical protein